MAAAAPFPLWRLLAEDLATNRTAGLLTLVFLVNFRLGQRLLAARRRFGAGMWIFYIFPLVTARILAPVFGCSVPFCVQMGRRVRFRHGLYGVFVSGRASIGDDCEILHQVTIGAGRKGSPQLGPGVFVGAGAKIIGKVHLGQGCKIGAQALVVTDVPDRARCFAPPARIVEAAPHG